VGGGPRALEDVDLIMTMPPPPTTDLGRCRFCATPLAESFVDLGMSPLSNAYPPASAVLAPELFFPLHAFVCSECFLVQLHELQSPSEIFTEYAYFSSFSSSWLAHCQRFAAAMTERLGLGPRSRVVEIASNDGYLLKYFQAAGIAVLGVEPAKNVAAEAIAAGVPTLVEFFGTAQARRMVAAGQTADLLVGNNVLAHVPDLNDFVAGLAIVLAAEGVLSMEFPHLARLVEGNQFDTIYHEHFSYLSLITVERVFAHHGLRLFDVEELATHGGSLRVIACRTGAAHAQTGRVEALRAREIADGYQQLETYRRFAPRVIDTKCAVLEFLIGARKAGKRVVGYGAPAKGNTLLNFCGVRGDLVEYTVDRNPYKQTRLLPGTRIPIRAPEEIARTRPDYVLILPWNLRTEITEQLAEIRAWGGKFVVPIPRVEIF
jgi:C-methyltransferase-like protein/putative zinc binding protein/methyltransferase family protein